MSYQEQLAEIERLADLGYDAVMYEELVDLGNFYAYSFSFRAAIPPDTNMRLRGISAEASIV